jgi:hypothetical protein
VRVRAGEVVLRNILPFDSRKFQFFVFFECTTQR